MNAAVLSTVALAVSGSDGRPPKKDPATIIAVALVLSLAGAMASLIAIDLFNALFG